MEWFEEWFGEEYLRLYPHRDDRDAERAVSLIHSSEAGGCSMWRAALDGMREPSRRRVEDVPAWICP
jgi:hypothetical protein